MLREQRPEDRLAPARDPASPGIIRRIQERDARTGTYMYRNRPEAALASLLAALVILASPVLTVAAGQGSSSLAPSVEKMTAELVAAHGEAQRPRIARCLAQVASLWRPEDGDAASFEEFARRNFAADDVTRKALRDRMDRLHEQIDGSFNEMTRAFRWQADVEAGPILPFDELFAAYDPAAHVDDDLGLDARAVGRGAHRRPLPKPGSGLIVLQQVGHVSSTPTGTSPATTSGCTTCSMKKGNEFSRPVYDCFHIGTCAMKSKPITQKPEMVCKSNE